MAKVKISDYSTTANNNTDINSINIGEGCAPSGINDAIRELMRQLKEFQTGGAGDSVNSGGDFSVATNKFTVASATGNTAVAGTLGATGNFAINTDKFTVTASSGNTAVAGTLASTGNFAVNTDKFSVTAASGNTSVAGTLGAAGNFAVNTDKFTVAASTGNTAVAGTFAVTGATTLTGALVANGNSTLGDADTDTVTLNASFVNGTTLKTAKTATNTLALAAYDVDGTAYTNLVTLTAGNTPSLALTSTAVGTINNMSIGATTASTGAFTTLSASSDVTLSGGTANGVLYLNGSKVATSGSALVFDGTNLGVGTNSPLGKLDARGDLYVGANARILITEGGTGDAVIGGRAGTAFLALTVGGTEQARLTSTGLGIGTTSPSAKLDVQGSAIFARVKSTSTTYNGFRAQNDNGNFYFGLDDASGTFYGTANARAIYADGAYPMVFYTNAAERMRLDSSGNLGLGVTPSAWASGGKAFELSAGSLFSYGSGASGELDIAYNAYFDGSWKYKASSSAVSLYSIQPGIYKWFTAASGTAGSTITFTQAMTLDSSGNLLVGTTSAFGRTGISCQLAISAASGRDAGYFLQTTNSQFAVTSHVNTTTGTRYHVGFGDGTTWTERGTISTNGSATSYNTSSDYRLKNITGPISNSGAYIDSLKPVEGTWKENGSVFVGLIAHEVQEVSRTSIATGEKDGEKMQSMDYSSAEIIANLIAEVKSLRARVAALES
ncbi:hyaluronidasE [Caudoviricetes sp.]|nr:hyaluronidasE [Caudoviricetes sp.]UOF78364.1 hyaluronidasE [Bacteriophage sp.]